MRTPRFVSFIAILAILCVACEKPAPTPEPVVENINLSENGTSNCYLITSVEKDKTYEFDATVMGNGESVSGLAAPKALKPADARLVWQDHKGMVTELKYEEGKISFKLNSAEGNALIAAIGGSGSIIWSWHIWAVDSEAEGVSVSNIPTNTGYSMQSMNLGATKNSGDPACFGLLYQWGRKDPFPGSPVLTGDTSTLPTVVYDAAGAEVTIGHSSWTDVESNTLAYAIANPTVVLSNYKQYATTRDWLIPEESNDNYWGAAEGKSYYDPCPVGYKVPTRDAFQDFTTSGGYDTDYANFKIADLNGDGVLDKNDFDHGFAFRMAAEKDSFFPAAARYDGSYAMLYGSVSGLWGNYWYCEAYDGMVGGASALAFQATSVSPIAGGSRADAYSVRCVRELVF